MRLIRVSDRVTAIIDRAVADGVVSSEAEFLDAAVRRYAEELEDDTNAMLAAATTGIADIEAGRFTTIACQADVDALRLRLRARSKVLLEQMGDARADGDRSVHRASRAAE